MDQLPFSLVSLHSAPSFGGVFTATACVVPAVIDAHPPNDSPDTTKAAKILFMNLTPVNEKD